ncbi:unnamed protein product [Ectocarpus sp. 12 AP-2014]
MIISNYEIGKEIGSGAFGTVNIGEDRKTGEKVAVKCISKSRIQRSNMGSQVKKEITTMKKLDHPNIVGIKEVLMSNSHLYLVLEFAGGGELFTKIASQGKLSERVAKRHFKQIMEAVKFCHNLYICHRDIKPENILLDDEDNVKIADFGFASITKPEPGSEGETKDGRSGLLASIDEDAEEESSNIQPLRDFVPDVSSPPEPKTNKFRNLPSKVMQKMSTMCGTTQYMAPEIVNRDSYRGDKAAIWSCGVVLFVLLSGYLPFDSNDTGIVVQKIKSGRFDIPSFIPGLARDVIKQLLTPNPLVRPGARTILDHEWFKDITGPVRPTSIGRPGLPRNKSTLPAPFKKEISRLVSLEDKKNVLAMGLSAATSKVVGLLRANAWMQKPDDGSSMKASKMTSTGLAMIQVIVEKASDTTTEVEVEVFGRQKNSGAREINKLVGAIKALTP